jgi:2',3'-cyclic-nucleotide 2'-phosphodiesterase (5'-nucleotidase family)
VTDIISLTLRVAKGKSGRMKKSFPIYALGLGFLALSACSKDKITVEPVNENPVKKLSFVLTNDVHGHLEPKSHKTGPSGGLVTLGGIVSHLRSLPEYKDGTSGLFVLDSGDQFQGTLISNYDEGKAVFKAFNEIGYDAAVPGNHDYDFGPIGWLFDKVTPGQTSQNPREVIEQLANLAKFPLLSANTYYKATIKVEGTNDSVKLDSECKPANATLKDSLNFTNAVSPSFLKPYVIIEKAGVRVALIGLDNHVTASTTTIENVDDLCFRDEVATYLEIRKALEGKADVFVLMMHNGNSSNSSEGSEIVRKINEAYPNGVQLAAAGHTHFVHNNNIAGVHVMQDGAEAEYFGRADLYYDTVKRKVVPAETATSAGIQINPAECVSDNKALVCPQYPALPVAGNSVIQGIINDLKSTIAPMATEVVGQAKEPILRARIDECALGNVLTDALRKATGTEIAFMNAGGVRTDLPAGTIHYTDLFEVLPFSNRAVLMNHVKWSTLKKILLKSIQTCGNYGTLFQSGLRIQFSRDCSKGDLDPNAFLTRVETVKGDIIYDRATGLEANQDSTFTVTNLDFLASGGSGYGPFTEASTDQVLDIAREMIVDVLVKDTPVLTNQLDGRFKNVAP